MPAINAILLTLGMLIFGALLYNKTPLLFVTATRIKYPIMSPPLPIRVNPKKIDDRVSLSYLPKSIFVFNAYETFICYTL